jgi:hypothetical protein
MKQFVIGILVLVILSYAGCHILYPSRTVNFRITYEVETPEGLRTGTGVLAATLKMVPENPANGRIWSSWTLGEAIIVPVGERGTFYALLSSPSSPAGGAFVATLIELFGIREQTHRHEAQSVYNFAALSGRREVTYDQPAPISPDKQTMASILPILVRFKDEADPKTVEAVDPGNLAATFGEGVRLKRVIIEITKDPVTTDIQKRLTWLGPYPEPSLDPDNPKLVEPVANAPLKRLLNHGHFRSYAP